MRRWRLFAVAVLAFCGLMVGPAWAANQVTVQSRSVAHGATGVQVGVYVDNDVELSALQVPLEMRQLDPPSFLVGGFTWGPNPAGRITGSTLTQFIFRRLYGTPKATNTCSGPVSRTWETGGDTPAGAPGFYISPDAIIWTGIVLNPPPYFAAGTDGPVGAGTPSFLMRFDVSTQVGSFEIDTCCVAANNHLVFMDAMAQEVPLQFTKGIISVFLNQAPVAICQPTVVQAADQNCQSVVTPTQVNNGSYDPEGGAVALELSPSGPYPLGQTSVELIATDPWGAKDTCQTTITVVDATSPSANCPANIDVGTDPGTCGATVDYVSTATDNCPGALISCTPPPGTVFPVGLTNVRCIATDAAGNADTCFFSITVADDDPPEAQCRPDTVVIVTPGQTGAVVTYTSTATDNCPDVTVNCTPPSGSNFPLGQTLVRCIATDAVGNADTCYFNVFVAESGCFDRLADLNCDGIISVQDVVEAVNVAFRGKPNSEVKPCITPPMRR